ncbi:MAG: ribulose 1,5-bisphosphate carboxylase large subunit [Thiohalocapsa sp.]|uniref:RuBisCO large subunit C-terminal-like domain-containing protein n=1 Tax=Thiohalocapsa sp. TaxID=2497641 RepID=UPI0025D19C3D|nr:RuBisCO large subunit C-terminal-like domain-containing protein [Thiohalocapsa sp.]MCG6943658.1 ribulose 1,5-bisphosphate carboxylase large subunit [Thiohalocapsa sp.]
MPIDDPVALSLSGERLTAIYRIRAADEGAALLRAQDICLEQTVEFPAALIPSELIRAQIVGSVDALTAAGSGAWDVRIRYPVEAAGAELTQLVNLLFGNVALQPGVRLMDFSLPDGMLAGFRGPRFGITGLRGLLAVHDRPLLCTALKPMGLSAQALAALAYELALGGIDLIKDDHGLTDQPFCPVDERIGRCAEAVERANRETGRRCLYLPNVTAPAGEIARRARAAKAAGAGGLLFCPGLAGLDAMRALADDAGLAMPILGHPAFIGGLALSPDAGLSHKVLYGRLHRLAGADAAIFPHHGGRFAYSEAECRDILAGCTDAMGELAPIFPVPAGGMQLGRVRELRAFYGRDCILLIGGDLHAGDEGLIARARRFVALAGSD